VPRQTLPLTASSVDRVQTIWPLLFVLVAARLLLVMTPPLACLNFTVVQMHHYSYSCLKFGNASEMGGGQPKAHVQAGHITMCPSLLGAFLAFASDFSNMP